jgi:simple sugar transport system permease protein
MEALKFSTPLIFTGLAVAFGFQAGLFNIGAPGQMIIGGIFAMLVGVYLPGPRILVLPAVVIAAGLGGGLWGALPGWLKARFGASEVINTILLNLIAAAFLLFILSSNPSFAASAIRILVFIALVGFSFLAFALIPAARTFFRRAPRPILGAVGVLVLVGTIFSGLPRPGDQVVVLNLPFKVAGSEPKSQEVREAARLPQLPQLFGIDVSETPGTNEIPVNGSLVLGLIATLVAVLLLPKIAPIMSWFFRFGLALLIGTIVFGGTAGFGLTDVKLAIPPTNLNAAFLIAIATALVMHYVLWRTKWGYELRAVGVSPEAAEYGGVNIARNTIIAMTVSGAFAGLTACHYVLGGALNDFSLRQALPTGDGFDGIAVALLGGNSPLGIVLSAFLFGVLKNGGSVLNITFPGLTRDVVSMILALVVLFIAARGFLPYKFGQPLGPRRSGVAASEPTTDRQRRPRES